MERWNVGFEKVGALERGSGVRGVGGRFGCEGRRERARGRGRAFRVRRARNAYCRVLGGPLGHYSRAIPRALWWSYGGPQKDGKGRRFGAGVREIRVTGNEDASGGFCLLGACILGGRRIRV